MDGAFNTSAVLSCQVFNTVFLCYSFICCLVVLLGTLWGLVRAFVCIFGVTGRIPNRNATTTESSNEHHGVTMVPGGPSLVETVKTLCLVVETLEHQSLNTQHTEDCVVNTLGGKY